MALPHVRPGVYAGLQRSGFTFVGSRFAGMNAGSSRAKGHEWPSLGFGGVARNGPD
jgi:hypothetical protein